MAIDPKHLKGRKVIIYGRHSATPAGADPDPQEAAGGGPEAV